MFRLKKQTEQAGFWVSRTGRNICIHITCFSLNDTHGNAPAILLKKFNCTSKSLKFMWPLVFHPFKIIICRCMIIYNPAQQQSSRAGIIKVFWHESSQRFSRPNDENKALFRPSCSNLISY